MEFKFEKYKTYISKENNILIARMLTDTLGPAFLELLGGDEVMVRAISKIMDKNKVSLFSSDKIEVVLKDGVIAGLLITEPGELVNKMEEKGFSDLISTLEDREFFDSLTKVQQGHLGEILSIGLDTVDKELEKVNKPVAKDVYSLKFLSVNPEFRGCGIGKKLVEKSIKNAKEEGFDKIRLELYDGNTNAQKLYEKYNFKIVETLKSEKFGLKIHLMRAEL